MQYYSHGSSGWSAWRNESQRVTFDLGGHEVWHAKAAGTTITQPAFALDQMDASVAILPDGECVVIAMVQCECMPSPSAARSCLV